MTETHDSGGSLIETALVMPLLLIMLLGAVDFGYFFLVAANLVTSAHNAVLYSTQGFSTPAQQQIPVAGTAGSLADTSEVAGVAAGDLSGLANFSTKTQVFVCSKSLGIVTLSNGYRTKCQTYPSGTLSYTPDVDPESLSGLLLHRVDVVYTVTPPVSMHLFNFNIVPPVNFHWEVEMRAID